MSKHTPGPWRVSDFNNMGGAVVMAGSREVARTWGYDMGDMAANARLIAAAPEMLALLKDLTEECDPAIPESYDVMKLHALDLIAKAEDRS